MEMREATVRDVARIMEILDSAREYQRALGFCQWEDGYPSNGVIEADIATKGAYVFINGGMVVGYVFLAVGDRSYDNLTDTWLYDGKYGVIHRLAVSIEMRGKGVSRAILQMVEHEFQNQGINIIKVDTGQENKIMQHALESNHYKSRGYREFDWGWRVAYEKKLGMRS